MRYVEKRWSRSNDCLMCDQKMYSWRGTPYCLSQDLWQRWWHERWVERDGMNGSGQGWGGRFIRVTAIAMSIELS